MQRRTAVGVVSSYNTCSGGRRIVPCGRRCRRHGFMGGGELLPLFLLLLLLVLNNNMMMIGVHAQTDNSATTATATTAPAECLTALFNADLDGDKRLNKVEYFNAMMSLFNNNNNNNNNDPVTTTTATSSSSSTCFELNNDFSASFTNNFNQLKCTCFDYRYDDPLCCQVFNFAIRLPDETYPVDYANRICNDGIAQALWTECGIQAPWVATPTPTVAPTVTTITIAPTTAPATITVVPTTAAPTTVAPTTAPTPTPTTTAPTIRTVEEETTAVPTSLSPVVAISTSVPGPTTTTTAPPSTAATEAITSGAPSSVPPLTIVIVEGGGGDNNDDDDDANINNNNNNNEESTTSKSTAEEEDDNNNNDSDDKKKKARTLAASLSVFGILAFAAVAVLVQRRYRQQPNHELTLEAGEAEADDDDDFVSTTDQHSIQAVAVKGAINPFGFDNTEEEEISEVTLDDADLEAAHAVMADGPVVMTTATSYAQLQFGGGISSGKSIKVVHGDDNNNDDDDDDAEDPTAPTAVLPFRHLEINNNNQNDKIKNTPRVRMRRLLNALAFEASSPSPQQRQQQQQQQQQEESSFHHHITPLRSNTTLSRQASPVKVFDSQDEDDFGDQPSAAELLRNDSTDSWGAAMRRAFGLGGPSKEQEQQQQQQKEEQRNNNSEVIQADVNEDDHEQVQLQHQHHHQHHRHMHHHHHHHHHPRPVPRALDFDGDSSAPESSAGGSGWSDGSSTTTTESQEEVGETTPASAADVVDNPNNEKEWEWVRSFGGQFQI